MNDNINELIENQNGFIVQWGKGMAMQKLPSSVSSAGINPSSSTKPFQLRVNFYKLNENGARTIRRIGFSMAKHGVYQEKGVGKGRGINSGKTKPKPWFNPAVKNNIQELADTLALITGDTIINNLLIK